MKKALKIIALWLNVPIPLLVLWGAFTSQLQDDKTGPLLAPVIVLFFLNVILIFRLMKPYVTSEDTARFWEYTRRVAIFCNTVMFGMVVIMTLAKGGWLIGAYFCFACATTVVLAATEKVEYRVPAVPEAANPPPMDDLAPQKEERQGGPVLWPIKVITVILNVPALLAAALAAVSPLVVVALPFGLTLLANIAIGFAKPTDPPLSKRMANFTLAGNTLLALFSCALLFYHSDKYPEGGKFLAILCGAPGLWGIWMAMSRRAPNLAPVAAAGESVAVGAPKAEEPEALKTQARRYAKSAGRFANAAVYVPCLLLGFTVGRNNSNIVLGVMTSAIAAIICVAVWWHSREKARKLAETAVYMSYGLGKDEARTAAESFMPDSVKVDKFAALTDEYYRKHAQEIKALDAEFVRIATEKYGFNPDYVKTLEINSEGRTIKRAVLWHHDKTQPEDVARALYMKLLRTNAIRDRQIFSIDVRTGNPPKPATAAEKFLSGMITVMTIAAIYGLSSRGFMPSNIWAWLCAAGTAVVSVCATIAAYRRAINNKSPVSRKNGPIETAFFAAFLSIFVCSVSTVYALGDLLNWLTGEKREIAVYVETTYDKNCVNMQPEGHLIGRRLCFKDDHFANGSMETFRVQQSWFGIRVESHVNK